MNGLQSLSKRIRKRIQTSVKRLFTTKNVKADRNGVLGANSETELDCRKVEETCGVRIKTRSSLKSCSISNLTANSMGSKPNVSESLPPSGDKTSIYNKVNETNKELVKNVDSKESKKSTGDKNQLIVPSLSKHRQQLENKSSSDVHRIKSDRTKTGKKQQSTGKPKTGGSEVTPADPVCPTGRHPGLRGEEACICINLDQLQLYREQSVITEWHKFLSQQPPTRLDALSLEKPTTCIQGGQGVVFWVYDATSSRHYALKMKLRQNRGSNSWLIEQRESNILKKIQHNFIVNLFHVHETAGALFMTMEFLDGGCLWSHIAKKGTLPESYCVYYAACVLDALRYLHSLCIVYRDLKAENIVLDGLGRPKLIDFGMAKRISGLSSGCDTQNGEPMEKYPATQYYYAAYLAPEIYSRPSTANVNIDSWGLGYIVSEILLGYGVFVSMPWERRRTTTGDSPSGADSSAESEHDPDWSLKLDPTTTNEHVSAVCRNFLECTLLTVASARIGLEQAANHSFFRRLTPVWSRLAHVRPPDLSIFRRRLKGSGLIRAAPLPGNGLGSGNNATVPVFDPLEMLMPTPDPWLTPHDGKGNIQQLQAAQDVPSPLDTPVNPRAPSVRLPHISWQQQQLHGSFSNGRDRILHPSLVRLHSTALRCGFQPAASVTDSANTSNIRSSGLDTISNLRPNWRF